jgi:alanine dehydrogenase
MNRIGLRAEDKNRFERRAPLAPDHVRELAERHGIEFRVQPSPLRVFSDQDYEDAGAELSGGLADCPVVLGVKEIPPGKLQAGKTYVFFSHVVKGQACSMPMLRRLLELGCTLIDYERIVDPRGRRLIFFGRHAGYAGMLDSLWALGQRLAAEGFFTPLEHVRKAHQYASLEEALEHVARLGEHVRHVGLPAGLRPVVAAFTGSGNVSRGAQEVYDRLPVQEIEPEDLPALSEDRDRPDNAVYKTVLDRPHRLRRRDGGGFDDAEYRAHPERYESALPALLKHLTLLVNGVYWEPGLPVLVSEADLRALFATEPQPKLRVIGDVTCDIRGSIASSVRATDPGDPVYLWRPDDGSAAPGVAGRGVVMMTVDNLPCELPVEASVHFGDSLMRFVPALARCDWGRPCEDLGLPAALRAAVVAHQGRLTPGYAYLERALSARPAS